MSGSRSLSEHRIEDGELDRGWDGPTAAKALRATVRAFERHINAINALNVFPVPDGDTGTNMHLTLQAALDELDSHGGNAPGRVDELLTIITRGALMGARGNSGVILYQIIAGLSRGAESSELLDGDVLTKGLNAAAELAYRAVTNPVEGTMLTVIRVVSERCQANPGKNLTETIQTARQAAEDAVRDTPNQLPVLRQAGVVDAGGQGLLTIFTSLERFATGELDETEITLVSEPPASFASDMHFLDQAEVLHGMEEFGYCINFAVTGERLEARGIRETLDQLGQSTVIVGDDSLVKVHTHSEHPGMILEAALEFGELHNIRIDNMRSQTERLLHERHSFVEPYHPDDNADLELSIGIVAVASGDGVIHALKGMGVDTVVHGGASMNPSTGEIRDAIAKLNKSEVIVMPNDSNIIASAEQAAELSDRDVQVVPTHSVQQCIAAMASFNFDHSLDDNVKAMNNAITAVRSLSVTRAQRDVIIDDLEFRSGEYMGILDGKPCVSAPEASETIRKLFQIAEGGKYELATIFVGDSAGYDLVDELETVVQSDFPDLELEITTGGQPHYDLLIALE